MRRTNSFSKTSPGGLGIDTSFGLANANHGGASMCQTGPLNFGSMKGGYNAADLLEKNKDARAQRRQLLAHGVLAPTWAGGECPKCAGWQEANEADKKKFYSEIEHVRRGVQKCLTQLEPHMSSAAFQKFRASLQLDVRYCTAHGAEEPDAPTSPSHGRAGGGRGPKGAGDASPTNDDMIARLEAEIERLDAENQRLRDELRKAGATAGFVSSGGGGGKQVRTVDNQSQTDKPPPQQMQYHPTDPAHPTDPSQPAYVQPGQPGYVPPGGGGGPIQTQPGPGGVQVIQGAAGQTIIKEVVKTITTGIDPAELERIMRQRDAEKEKVKERDAEILALKARLQELEDKLANQGQTVITEYVETPTQGGGGKSVKPKAEIVAAGGKPKVPDSPEEEEAEKAKAKKKAKKTEEAKKRGGSYAPKDNRTERGLGGGGEGGEAGEEHHDDSSEPEEEGGPPPVEMVDKCVGNGPGNSLADEPVKIKGRGAKRPEEPMNKLGKSYDCTLRDTPSLGLGGSMSMGSTMGGASTGKLSKTAPAALASGGGRGNAAASSPDLTRNTTIKVPSGDGSSAYGGRGKRDAAQNATQNVPTGLLCPDPSKFADSAGSNGFASSSKPLSRSLCGVTPEQGVQGMRRTVRTSSTLGEPEAEPYLVDVWEQRPNSSRGMARRELLKLGAEAPHGKKRVTVAERALQLERAPTPQAVTA